MINLIDLLWVKVLCPLWSFGINLLYWVFHCFSLPLVLRQKKALAEGVLSVKQIPAMMKVFKWKKDSLKDWTPWIITFLHQDKTDDCDGAVVYAAFLFKAVGIKGKKYSLRGKTGHAIWVSNDLKWLVENNVVKEGNWTDNAILSYFNHKYKRIIK